MLKILSSIFCPFVAATAFAETPTKDEITRVDQSYYASIENHIKKEFDGAVALFKQDAVNWKNISKQEQVEAIDFLKMMSWRGKLPRIAYR